MGTKTIIQREPGLTLYGIPNNTLGQVWNAAANSGAGAWENALSGTRSQNAVSIPPFDVGNASGLYVLEVPPGITGADLLQFQLYSRLGVSPALADDPQGAVQVNWSGAAIVVGSGGGGGGSLTAANVWDHLLAGIATPGSVGKLVKDNLDTNVGSRLASGGYTAPNNSDIAAIKAKTEPLPAQPAAVGSAMTLTPGERNATALAILLYDWVGIVGEPGRCALNALRRLRNRTFRIGKRAFVTKEDDVTEAWAADLVTSTSAAPVTDVDPD